MKTIKEALLYGIEILSQSNIEQAQHEAQILLAYLLHKDKLYLHIHSDEVVPDEIYNKFLVFIEKRSAHVPIAYIIKEKEFMSLLFYVDERVLIPRGDTEILVEEAIRIARSKSQDLNILDLCCGSGCIGLSFAHYIQNAIVLLSDISKDALEVAARNSEALQLSDRVTLCRSDLFSELPAMKFDMILSNPPYISNEDIRHLEVDVKDHEPYSALSGGMDGMDYYNKIVSQAKSFLKEGGSLLFEIGYDQGEKVKELLIQNDYEDVCILKDYAGHDRVVKGILGTDFS